MRIVSINAVPPYPPTSGGQARTFNLLGRLHGRHDLTVLCFYRSAEEREGLAHLARLGWRIVAVPFARLNPAQPRTWSVAGRYLAAFGGARPAGVTHWDQPAMHAAVAEAAAGAAVVQAEETFLAPYVLGLPRGPIRTVTALDVYAVTLGRRLAVTQGWRPRWRLRREQARFARYEGWVAGQVDRVLVMSAVDAAFLREMNPAARLAVAPNGVDTRRLQPGPIRPRGQHLLFVGSPNHAPNVDAARWLLTEIWPALQRRRPDATLTLVYMDTPAVLALAAGQPGVRVTGRALDVTPYYREADLALAPLRIGSGTRLKILEAMALGVPILTTQVGAEGLALLPDQHAVYAETTAEWVDAACALLDDAARRHALAAAARTLAENRYDWDRIVEQIEAVYRELGADASR